MLPVTKRVFFGQAPVVVGENRLSVNHGAAQINSGILSAQII